MEEFCTIHPKEDAVGKCSRCRRPFCLDCLDMETGQVLCPDCLKAKPGGAPVVAAPPPVAKPIPQAPIPAPVPIPTPAPVAAPVVPATPPAPAPVVPPKAAASPLDFKGKGLEDDPFGLFAGGAPPKAPVPSPAPKPFVPDLKPLPLPPPVVPKPSPAPSAPAPKLPLDLDSLGSAPGLPTMTVKPGSPQAPVAPIPLGVPGLSPAAPKKGAKLYFLWKAWMKYLVRRAYETFDPIAQKLKVPTYAVIGLMVALLVGAILGIGVLLKPSSVKMVEILPPIHLIRVGAGQITDMDVTTFMDLEGKLQNMGFTSMSQLTVSQLPASNFFDVWIKEDVGTYGEILKLPGQITPSLSFVTVFNNGVWYSTNSWKGDRKEMEFLVSECFPGATPDQLYIQHVQGVEKMKKDEGWQVQFMGENRYLAALSDEIRWFLDKKDIPAYKADFALWH